MKSENKSEGKTITSVKDAVATERSSASIKNNNVEDLGLCLEYVHENTAFTVLVC